MHHRLPVTLLGLLLGASIASAAHSQSAVPDGNGPRTTDAEAMQSHDGFGGAVLATTDADWRAKWNTPPETQPSFSRADTVAYGQKVFILTFFSNARTGPSGKPNVRCDVQVTSPTGTLTLDRSDLPCFDAPLLGDATNLYLSDQVITFSGDPGDPPGIWSVLVVLRDAERSVAVRLRTSFELR